VDTLDFAGWALKTFRLPESLKGCYCKITGMELIRNTVGSKTGEIYLDALTFGVESGDSGLDSGIGSSFRIYPNPAGDFLTVDLSAFRGKAENIEILNMLGGIAESPVPVNHSQQVKISVGNLPEGMYLLNIRSDKGIVVKEIIVRR